MKKTNLPARFEGARFQEIMKLILSGTITRATQYISPKLIVRAVRRRFDKKIISRKNAEVILTIGEPNYIERDFIKACKKAGEPFPVKKIQLKLYNPLYNPKKLK